MAEPIYLGLVFIICLIAVCFLRLKCLYLLFIDAFVQNTALPFMYTSLGASRGLVASLLVSKEVLLVILLRGAFTSGKARFGGHVAPSPWSSFSCSPATAPVRIDSHLREATILLNAFVNCVIGQPSFAFLDCGDHYSLHATRVCQEVSPPNDLSPVRSVVRRSSYVASTSE